MLFATAVLGAVCYQEVSTGRGPVRVTDQLLKASETMVPISFILSIM